jgi:hypothetical protein
VSALRDFLDDPTVARARPRELLSETRPRPTAPRTLALPVPDSTGLGACSVASP